MTTVAAPPVTSAMMKDRVDAAVQRAFVAFSAEHQRGPHSFGISDLGGCTRRAAYALSGTDPTEEPQPDEARAANLGTWIHSGLLPHLAAELGGRCETPTTLHAAGLTVPGRIDLDFGDVVLDAKTVGERRLHGVRRDGPYADHRVQVLGYALARHQAGLPVRWVGWLYLDRATGDFETIVEPFTNTAAVAVITRATRLTAAAQQPDKAPREGRGPGLSFACDGCPWLRRCWGPDAKPGAKGAQRRLQLEEPGVEALLRLADDASARKAAASRDWDYAKAGLDGARRGAYGPWSLRWAKDGRPLVGLTERLSKRQLADLNADDVAD